MDFPIPLDQYQPMTFDLSQPALTKQQKETLQDNIHLLRDSIVFFTALANKKGLGGHTGGAYDIVPEILIVDGFIRGTGTIYPVCFDEAGHRVAIQYLMAALNGHMPIDQLLHYREFGKGLYGHPEREDERGIFFSSGRLGHLWSYVNGVAAANPDKMVVLFGSDGAQQEGGDAEAARYAVANQLNVKLLIDDNDITIAGNPSAYMPGFDVGKTLTGHGMTVTMGPGEDLDNLFGRVQAAFSASGPWALVNKRVMAAGVPGIEGVPKAHDVIPVALAIPYLEARGHTAAVEMLSSNEESKEAFVYLGSTAEKAKNRDNFGKIVCDLLQKLPDPKEQVLVVDSDLEGSCGLHHIRKAFPEVYVNAGIMERNNYSVAAGFGSTKGRQGIFGTFSAFMEMVISEITMARLNRANVLAHFSHAGVDDMADNTCHFGINNFFCDNGLSANDRTQLFFPADSRQLRAVLEAVFHDNGLRFIFSTRSATPFIEDENGNPFFGGDYVFTPGKDEIIRSGSAGYVISYGEMLYRCLHVVETLKAEGLDVGLINKPTLNRVDETMMDTIGAAPFALVVETQSHTTGLGSKFGTWLLERGHTSTYAHMGATREGSGGLAEQIPFQGLGLQDIKNKVRSLS